MLFRSEITFLEFLMFLARRWQLIVIITIIAAAVSAIVASNMSATYVSSTKLLILQYADDTTQRISSNGRLVFGKKEGQWQPADTTILRSILESSTLRQLIGSKHGVEERFTLQATQEKLPGVLSVRVEGKNQGSIAKIAAAAIYEAGQQALRMGVLPTPILFLDEKPGKLEGNHMGVSVLEPPNPGVKVRPDRSMIVLLSSLAGFFISICLAIILEYFRCLSDVDRMRFREIKAMIRGLHVDT